MKIQNEYLAEIRAEKGTVTIADMDEIYKDIYIMFPNRRAAKMAVQTIKNYI